MYKVVLKRENNNTYELSIPEFKSNFIEICKSHHLNKKALVFAFLLYDFTNPEISKILNDSDYWKALDYLSGKYLSIFYIHNDNKYLMDEREDAGVIYNMISLKGNKSPHTDSKIILNKYFGINQKLELPTILFFQVNNEYVSKYYFVELKQNMVQQSFAELFGHIEEVVKRLKLIESNYYDNYDEIFEQIQNGLKNRKNIHMISNVIRKIPVLKILGLILPE